jgi:hypothetical protein
LNQCYSLIPCLFFSFGLILPVLLWFCLLSFFVCKIPWRMFCSGGLVLYIVLVFLVIEDFYFSILNDNFAG